MLFYFIRHGDPVYSPNSLTELGKRQAEALAKRLALHGIDKIYSSTSERAYQTAVPTSILLSKPIEKKDFASEDHTWREYTVETDSGDLTWTFQDRKTRFLLNQKSVTDLGFEWYDHPDFEKYRDKFKGGQERIYRETSQFFESLGYKHIDFSGTYEVIKDNDERIALFAHQGFGLAFLSCVLDIPYPRFCTHFDICHTGMTVIEFKNEGGMCIPRVCMLSSDSHIYKEGLPTYYNNIYRI